MNTKKQFLKIQKLSGIGEIPEPPIIPPVPEGVERPLFSVMIPVCNRIKYLRQTLESVLVENYPPAQMQICIVDNSTEAIDWEVFLTAQERQRIEIFKQPKHVGMAENWNTCITLSLGHLVHILHDDDWVLPGFYDEMKSLQKLNECPMILATRSFVVDSDGVIEGVSERVKEFEKPSRNYESIALDNYLRCPGIVVDRKVYESIGGYLPCFSYVLDWEMWIRGIINHGIMFSKKVLVCYRFYSENATFKEMDAAKNLREQLKLILHFNKSLGNYPIEEAYANLLSRAAAQEELLRKDQRIKAAADAKQMATELTLMAQKRRPAIKWLMHGIGNRMKQFAEKL